MRLFSELLSSFLLAPSRTTGRQRPIFDIFRATAICVRSSCGKNSRFRSASCHIIALDALDAIVYSRHQLLDGVCSAFGCKVGAECLAYQENVTQSSWNTSPASSTKIRQGRRDNDMVLWLRRAHGPGAERRWSYMHAELLGKSAS